MNATPRSASAIALRRSIGFVALPALVALVVVNVLARGKPWVHEWLWAIYNFHFVTVLLGPLAAGLAAWEGYRISSARDLYLSADRVRSALALSAGALLAWVLVAYLLGVALVGFLVVSAGTPGFPGGAEMMTFLPALGLLTFEVTTSLVAGWYGKSPFIAPLAAGGWFAITLLFYVVGPQGFVTVGGASDSLIGLAPRTNLQLAQVVWFSVGSLIALWIADADWLQQRRLLSGFLLAVALGAAALLLSQEGLPLRRVESSLACRYEDPQICVGPGYVNEVQRVRSWIIPYIRALQRAGAPVPPRFDQNVDPGNPDAAPVPVFLLLGDRSLAGPAVTSWYVANACPLGFDSKATDSFLGLTYWLEGQVHGAFPDDPTVPSVLRDGSIREQHEWVRGAVDVLQSCG